MKKLLYTSLLVVLVSFSAIRLVAQNPPMATFTQEFPVYFDTQMNELYQVGAQSSWEWSPGETVYFSSCGGQLNVSNDPNELVGCENTYDPNYQHNFTVSIPKLDDTHNANLISLFFTGINSNDPTTEGYILLQFTTVTQTDLDNPNSLKIQSNHAQIEWGTICRIDYVGYDVSCTNIQAKLVVYW